MSRKQTVLGKVVKLGGVMMYRMAGKGKRMGADDMGGDETSCRGCNEFGGGEQES